MESSVKLGYLIALVMAISLSLNVMGSRQGSSSGKRDDGHFRQVDI